MKLDGEAMARGVCPVDGTQATRRVGRGWCCDVCAALGRPAIFTPPTNTATRAAR